MIEDSEFLGKLLDRKQLKKISSKIDPPTQDELVTAINKTLTEKAMANDSML